MTHAEKHASNSSGMSGDGSQRGASRYLRTDCPPPEERIRRRTYELYREYGSQPADGVADWPPAESEYYEVRTLTRSWRWM
jgi:hypothetical protein